MFAHKLKVTVPGDHRLSLDLPGDFPPGPAEVIVLATSQVDRKIVRAGGVLSRETPLQDGDPVREALDDLRQERAERLEGLVAEFETDAAS